MKLPEILTRHNLKLKDISDWFGYKNLRSFQRSSGGRRIEIGLERFYQATREDEFKKVQDHLDYAMGKGVVEFMKNPLAEILIKTWESNPLPSEPKTEKS